MIDQLPINDLAWGIDRYISSPTQGKLIVPVVYLWVNPGAVVAKQNLTGAVKHNTPVMVTNHKLHNGESWFFVKQDTRHEGRTYPQRGWCKAVFLLALGDRHVDFGDGANGAAAYGLPFQPARGQA